MSAHAGKYVLGHLGTYAISISDDSQAPSADPLDRIGYIPQGSTMHVSLVLKLGR